MRKLVFDVNKQRITKNKDCDFRGLVAGSIGYLTAEFDFSSSEWSRCTNKVARFWVDEKEYAELLNDSNCCEIPSEVLTGRKFEVSVLGVSPGYRIETNRVAVRQEVR